MDASCLAGDLFEETKSYDKRQASAPWLSYPELRLGNAEPNNQTAVGAGTAATLPDCTAQANFREFFV